jgi:hypothetical protein
MRHRQRIVQRLAGLFVALLLSVTPLITSAHGSLAVGANGGFGYSYDYASPTEAQQAAMARCNNAGGVSCSVRGNISGVHAAFARGTNHGWGWGYAGTPAEAQNMALQYCRQATTNCAVLAAWNDQAATTSPGTSASSKPGTSSSGEGLSMSGNLSFECNGTYCVLRADKVDNDGSRYNRSGSLRLELWRMASAYSGSGGITGYKVAQHDLGQLEGRHHLYGISSGSVRQLVANVTGYCKVALVLSMYTGAGNNDGYRIVDYMNFSGSWNGCNADPPLTDKDCLFRWAESQFSNLFAPNGRSNRRDGNWLFRHYESTGISLGFHGEQIYIWGNFYGSSPIYVGMASDFLPIARADSCR